MLSRKSISLSLLSALVFLSSIYISAAKSLWYLQTKDTFQKTEEGYILDSKGDTIPYTITYDVKPVPVEKEQLKKPVIIPSKGKNKIVKAHKNVEKARPPVKIKVPIALKTYIPGKAGIPLPDTIAAKITEIIVKHPEPKPAMPMAIKDNATFNIQYASFEQGLAGGSVNCMIQDSRKNLWFGTARGLTKYDGQFFTTYSFNEGLPHDDIIDLLEDKKGNIWLTSDRGVVCYDGYKFSIYTQSNGQNKNVIRSLTEDHMGNIWVGTNSGASMFDGEYFINFNASLGLQKHAVLAIEMDQNGDIWLGTSGKGIFRFDGSEFHQLTKNEGLLNSYIFDIEEDEKGRIWFSNLGRGVSCIDRDSILNYTTNEGLLDNNIYEIYQDRNNDIWFTSWSGVSQFDGFNFTRYTTKDGLNALRAYSILEDDTGNLWLGMDEDGVCKLSQPEFNYFNSSNGLSSDQVLFILEDRNGTLIFSMWDGGFSTYNGEEFSHTTNKHVLNDELIIDMLEDGQKNIWYTTLNNGIFKYDGKQYFHYSIDQGLSSKNTTSVFEDSNGKIWIGTNRGVSIFSDGNFSRLLDNNGMNSPIWNIHEDSQQNIWIGTRAGLNKYDGEKLTHYTIDEGTGYNGVFDIEEAGNGDIWLATQKGVLRYTEEDFIWYTDNDGLSHNRVSSVVEDHDNNIWVSTYKGITLFAYDNNESATTDKNRFDDYQIHTFEKEDGLIRPPVVDRSGFLDSKNRIWWASMSGLIMLDLNEFQLPDKTPVIQLEYIKINENYIPFQYVAQVDDIDSMFLDLKSKISFSSTIPFKNLPVDLNLTYDLNHLTFHFQGIDWAAPHKLKYSHMLEDIDNDWSQPQSESFADYRNLPHGQYSFKVKTIGAAKKWSEPYEYTFSISPPWWLSWWAKTLYVLIGFSLIYGYIRYRTYALRKRQKELEQTVTERTAEVVAQKEVIQKEKERSDELLLNILPSETAEELKQYGSTKSKNYDEVTVLFSDFKDFTLHSERLGPEELVAEIDHCFKAFDHIMEKYNVEKIKTVGDAYMAAAGLPTPNTSNPLDAVRAALDIRDFMIRYRTEKANKNEKAFEIRIGVHTGPVVAGIVGVKKFAYDIWGDTVNIASRMESNSEVGKVNVSQSSYTHLKDHPEFSFFPRGEISVKNKGKLEMYFVENVSRDAKL